jgi:aminobenzoyl-glutamate utilization protein B
VNFMREHGYDPADARIQNVIPEGGHQPNVVPGEATDWYYIRAKSPELVMFLLDWMRDIAKGAALSTRTEVSERILSGSWPYNGNKALAEAVDRNVRLVGMPKWSPDDVAFAKAVQTSMGQPIVGLPMETTPLRSDGQGSSTSDAGDVSWQMPLARLYIPTTTPGALAGHHWSAALGPATPIAHKGIAAGAKAVAATALDLFTDPALLSGIKADFTRQLAAYPAWKSFIPADAKPPTYLNVEEMGRYRAALAPYEYDPNGKATYFQFLKAAYPPAAPATAVGRASNAPKATFEKSSIDWDWRK